MRLNVIFVTQKWLFAAVLLHIAGVSNAQTVQFFDESAGASTTPIPTFLLPPPWSSISSAINPASNKNLSYAKLGVKVQGAGAGVQVTRLNCVDPLLPAGTSFLIGSTSPMPIAVTDSSGIAHFTLTAQKMVTPLGQMARTLSCEFLINGQSPGPRLTFSGANYLPVDLSINGQATGTVQAESAVPALLKHNLMWLPDEFSATTFASGRQVQSAACVMANAPTTTASVAFSGQTNSIGVVQGAITSQNLHVPSTMFARNGTCTLSVVRLAGEVVPATPVPQPVVVTVQGAQWDLIANNTAVTGAFGVAVRGGAVLFRINSALSSAPSVGQVVMPDTTTACTVPAPGTSLSASDTTTVSTSNVSGAAKVSVTGPLNLPNQSLTGKCRFRLQNHKDVATDVTVIGQNICLSNPLAEPRHTACTTGVSRQALVIDLASIDGAGTYQGSVTASAPGASTQVCASGRCVLDFPANAQVTVAATPAANASVASWEYDCTAELPARVSSVLVGMSRARHCAIKFGPLASLTNLIGGVSGELRQSAV